MPYQVFAKERGRNFKTANEAKKYARNLLRGGIKTGYTITEEVIEQDGVKYHRYYLLNSKGTVVNGAYVKYFPSKGRRPRPRRKVSRSN